MGKEVRITLYELMKSRKISSIRELSRLTDIRHAALSQLANQKREFIHIDHIRKIAESLKVSDSNEIIRIVDTDDQDE
ncbi:helix-turn-helix domain-containing protein [Mesobacillus maritimus]|uniref:helix-turn-helix domain-containing protein n=1 Tax=Mesobacillus maritimus TaxID=1643336 RepID=UPI00203C0D16|nr:helix-turn-helix domain-containing protein [Mesobacillus maritimus]MCM3586992.1 helix-turn-helix domain-containing protein [Mesobacillus maritimus]